MGRVSVIEGDTFGGVSAQILIEVRDMRVAAIYDRASSKPQATNYARLGNGRTGLEFANHFGLEVIRSEDKRCDGVSFLDVCSGILWETRASLKKILADDRVDTVIVSIGFDRLARGSECYLAIKEMVLKSNKNLVVLEYDSVYNLWRKMLSQIAGVA